MNTLGLVIDAHTTVMVRRAAQRQRVTLDVWITIALRAAAAETLREKGRGRKPIPRRAKVAGIPLDESPC